MAAWREGKGEGEGKGWWWGLSVSLALEVWRRAAKATLCDDETKSAAVRRREMRERRDSLSGRGRVRGRSSLSRVRVVCGAVWDSGRCALCVS